jgi:hypothetical protein
MMMSYLLCSPLLLLLALLSHQVLLVMGVILLPQTLDSSGSIFRGGAVPVCLLIVLCVLVTLVACAGQGHE